MDLQLPLKIINLDWQMVTLNLASVGTVMAATIEENSTGWAVGFLIVTVGVLNLAKAYATIRESKRKNKSND